MTLIFPESEKRADESLVLYAGANLRRSILSQVRIYIGLTRSSSRRVVEVAVIVVVQVGVVVAAAVAAAVVLVGLTAAVARVNPSEFSTRNRGQPSPKKWRINCFFTLLLLA